MADQSKLGVSGRLARAFKLNAITPLLALVALLLGVFAVLVTPREEEPQINVTMANVLIPFPGASSTDVHNMVARPAEQVLSQIAGIEHTYSVARRREVLSGELGFASQPPRRVSQQHHRQARLIPTANTSGGSPVRRVECQSGLVATRVGYLDTDCQAKGH